MKQSFSQKVFAVVGQIPESKVMTYGQIAALCGSPQAARVVGQIAHFGPPTLPWHRVVNARGGLARGYVPDGPVGQSRRLVGEGISVVDGRVNLKEYVWWPNL